MAVIGLIIIIITLIYFFYLLFMAVAWKNRPRVKTDRIYEIPVSIIVPFRNEEQFLETCLQSLKNQDYEESKVEIIFVNDHSEDGSVDILKKHEHIKRIDLAEGVKGKKAALNAGINAAINELIITRDADTHSNSGWLRSIVSAYLHSNAKMIVAPVTYTNSSGWLNAFQQLELFAVALLTGASIFIKRPFMCNGANLAFSKTAFAEVNGYSGNEHLASGDDVFLLNKFRNAKNLPIIYLKNPEALVFTPSAQGFWVVLQQRVRWLKKGKFNKNRTNILNGLLIGGTNILVLFLGVLSLFIHELTPYFIYTAILKCFIDILLLFLASSYFKQRKVLWFTPFFLAVYPLFVFGLMIMSIAAKTEWKGRKI